MKHEISLEDRVAELEERVVALERKNHDENKFLTVFSVACEEAKDDYFATSYADILETEVQRLYIRKYKTSPVKFSVKVNLYTERDRELIKKAISRWLTLYLCGGELGPEPVD